MYLGYASLTFTMTNKCDLNHDWLKRHKRDYNLSDEGVENSRCVTQHRQMIIVHILFDVYVEWSRHPDIQLVRCDR